MKIVSVTEYRLRHLTGDRVSVLSDGELHIRDVRDEDRYSTYTCVARNILTGDEKPSKAAYLHVHGMLFMKCIVREALTVSLECSPFCFPSRTFNYIFSVKCVIHF